MRATNFLFFAFLFTFSISNAQTVSKPTIAVLDIDARNFKMAAEEMSQLLRFNITNSASYQVMDYYDMSDMLNKSEVNFKECYSKSCMLEAGKVLYVDKVLSGSMHNIDEKFVVNLRILDVSSNQIEKSISINFMNYRHRVGDMLKLSLKQLLDQDYDLALMQELSQPTLYEQESTNDRIESLRLSGPRMGLTIFSGPLADLYSKPEEEGGYGASSVMMQFGYQFELKFYSSEETQVLFEIVPILTGLEQGLFLPSCSFLTGIRSNTTGFEFAAGPILNIVNMDLDLFGDSLPSLKTSFVMAIGKSFKSGRLNLPVNAFFIPGKNGSHRFGISMGFNFAK